MKFGKVTSGELETIDFNLPDIDSETIAVLSGKRQENIRVRFGATGWGMDEWKGLIYPEKCPKTSYLTHYAKSFDTIELNSLHYRIPKVETIIKWKSQVGSSFRFCPKVLQYISHSRALGTDSDRIVKFCDAIAHFEENLGISFMQLPPYWDISRLHILEAFFKQWPKGFPIAIEVRHPSFFENVENANRYFDLLQSYDATPVITDVAGARYLTHLRLTNSNLFVRWVGNDFHYTDELRLRNWVRLMEQLINIGVDDIYFFPHQPENLKPPETTDFIISEWRKLNPSINLRKISWTNREKQLLLF